MNRPMCPESFSAEQPKCYVRLHLRGVVQGVGMRPAIWRLASDHTIEGCVANDGQGVVIFASAAPESIERFLLALQNCLPGIARIDQITRDSLSAQDYAECLRQFGQQAQRFFIARYPVDDECWAAVAPDTAVCDFCLAEMSDPTNRRFGYAFTHCASCGPRWSIVRRLPFERANTSMDKFPLCNTCQSEYSDPLNRRFHAQTLCCPDCGPQVWLSDHAGKLESENPINLAALLLKQGQIIAIKGLGGFHLACDAGNFDAIERLRLRKRRDAKPLALMARDIAMIECYSELNDLERKALSSPAAPIVLLETKPNQLPSNITMGLTRLGFMLPYTPLHHLLLQLLDRPIVLTSGNVSDEPPCLDNEHAFHSLSSVADYWLMHDRDILHRLDDSVMHWSAGAMRLIRRARGYVPDVVKLPKGFEQADGLLALGGELKSTFCLLSKGQALVGPHFGDLKHADVFRQYQSSVQEYQACFSFSPQQLVTDLHPAYLSSQYALSSSVSAIEVQHHHAHFAACLAEHGVERDTEACLGLIFDGLGLGTDGTLWGGEFLLADYRSYRRVAHFPAIGLLGGMRAVTQPWRNTYAHLCHYFDWQQICQDFAGLDAIKSLQQQPLASLDAARSINCPLSSAIGRWFDAFAGLLGLHFLQIDYEGQAAIALEQLAQPEFNAQIAYSRSWRILHRSGTFELDWQGLWLAVLQDLSRSTPHSIIAARIHRSFVAGCVELIERLGAETSNRRIILSGGVMQNRLLTQAFGEALSDLGWTPLFSRCYPANDGGLALGQAVIAAVQYRRA